MFTLNLSFHTHVVYQGNVLTSSIYTLDYYAELASQIKATGAHILVQIV